MKKLCAVLVLVLGASANLGMSPKAEFPRNYQLWMPLSLLADCGAPNGKVFTYAIHGSVPEQAVISLSLQEDKWGSYVYWREAKAAYFLKNGGEIRAVEEKELQREVAAVAGPTAPSWLSGKSIPEGRTPKSPHGKGKLIRH